MSLINPNKVVTEQRLNEYHNAILPYLGGMPEMVVNKFSKGDLYSTEERMIGQWIDGKPLYQKTFTGNLSGMSSDTVTATSIDVLDLSIENIVDIKGILTADNGSNFGKSIVGTARWLSGSTLEADYISSIVYNSGNTHAIIINVRDRRFSGQPYNLTLQYTKTTDSPISIGSDTDYSTEEKIIGTWINGKPLYQKTIYISNFPESASSFAHNIANINQIIDVSACMFVSNGGIRIFKGRNEINADNSSISITGVQGYAQYMGYSTIQYTKTTD